MLHTLLNMMLFVLAPGLLLIDATADSGAISGEETCASRQSPGCTYAHAGTARPGSALLQDWASATVATATKASSSPALQELAAASAPPAAKWLQHKQSSGRRSPGPAPPPKLKLGLLAQAPMPHLVREAARKRKEKELAKARGDLHYTTHGCHCLSNWTYEGEDHKSCSRVNTTFAHGWPWCKVVKETCDDVEGNLTDGAPWDFCADPGEIAHLTTVHGCHCSPLWEYKEKYYHNCAKTSKGPEWCYVFEGNNLCSHALRTEHNGDHWDYCFSSSDIPTVHGCHCMPEYTIDDVKYEGCSFKQNTTGNMSCLVVEDRQACPNATNTSVPLFGTTFVLDECIPGAKENKSKESVEYNCSAAFENWQAEWSTEKQDHCCHTEGRACVEVWPQVWEDNAICTDSDHDIETQEACQREAASFNKVAYQYSTTPSKCGLCSSSTPIRTGSIPIQEVFTYRAGTSSPYRIYSKVKILPFIMPMSDYQPPTTTSSTTEPELEGGYKRKQRETDSHQDNH